MSLLGFPFEKPIIWQLGQEHNHYVWDLFHYIRLLVQARYQMTDDAQVNDYNLNLRF